MNPLLEGPLTETERRDMTQKVSLGSACRGLVATYEDAVGHLGLHFSPDGRALHSGRWGIREERQRCQGSIESVDEVLKTRRLVLSLQLPRSWVIPAVAQEAPHRTRHPSSVA
jgi:hypothetical protein